MRLIVNGNCCMNFLKLIWHLSSPPRQVMVAAQGSNIWDCGQFRQRDIQVLKGGAIGAFRLGIAVKTWVHS